MSGDLVIGLDSSTSATKAIAWTRDGKAVAEGRAQIPMSNPHPGHFEQDPEDWWGSAVAALGQIAAAVDPSRIAAIAISNQRESFGLFDESGRALRPGTLWLDDRARAQERRFAAEFGEERIHAISGKPRDITPCLYRMVWLREHEPDIFARTERMAEVHGYLAFRLTGDWATSTASADPMGVVDMANLVWSKDILDAAGVPLSMMLRLVPPGQVIGEVTGPAAAATGLRPGTPVVAGGGDGQCAGTGAEVLVPGRAYINLGTAVVSGSYGKRYAYDRAFRTEQAIADSGYVYETCMRGGAFLVEWLAREMYGADPRREREIIRTLEAEARQSPIGAGGVVVLPFWQGCMTPHWDSTARGVMAGLSGSTRRGDIYRALLEGIAIEQAQTTNQAEAATAPIDHYVAIGGGASTDFWPQILADATARPVKLSTTVEASSLGAAMAAAKGAGWYATLDEACGAMAGRIVKTLDPDPERVARYAELTAIHADLWPTISAWNRRLSAFAETSHV